MRRAGHKRIRKEQHGEPSPTPALTHTPSQCCQSTDEKIRPSKKQTHTPPAVNHRGQEQEATHHHRLQFNPTANGTRPQPAANKQISHTSKQSPKEPHAEADPHQPMTRRLTPCGHTECTVSSIDLILRPSLEDASVSDGP
ncbi:hypothetical protein TcCL_Unassigned03415 [Trypanosoma cruzi]|nr:hypothetical protein TcCL_Unassigned03415 [Trypanosoma cruzi]